jgi:hypothetical protein
MTRPNDTRFSSKNIGAMVEAMDKIIKDEALSDERKQQMIDAIRRLYLGEPTKFEIVLRRLIAGLDHDEAAR